MQPGEAKSFYWFRILKQRQLASPIDIEAVDAIEAAKRDLPLIFTNRYVLFEGTVTEVCRERLI